MKKIRTERVLLFLAAAFAAYNFGMAGGLIEGRPVSIGGLVGGVVVNLSVALSASAYGSLQGKRRTRQALAALMSILVLSPLLVAPAVYYALPADFLGGVPVLRALWAVAWPLVADLAIILAGAVSGKSLIALSATAETLPKDESKKPRKKRQAERKRMTDDALMAFLAKNPGATHQQVAEHFGVSRQAVGPRVRKLYAVSQKGSA